MDDRLAALLERAAGRELQEIVAEFRGEEPSPDAVRAAVACLTEAGLLARSGDAVQAEAPPTVTGPLVSVIIVTYNSAEWLAECFGSLFSQSYSPLEAVVVDNSSSDGSADWVAANYPEVKLLRIEKPVSLAAAINRGVAMAEGRYLLLLNPDVRVERDAVAELVATAEEEGPCAAVAAKLKFSWAPAFLNGVGNRVGAFSWGTDNGIGHLDVGQFDSWREVPSACFAAALIPRAAWEAVGALDERFPMYYEDSEWSYRARLLGYSVRLAPKAVVYHAFGARVPSGEEDGLPPWKLRRAAYGRLRFALKIVGMPLLLRFLYNYLMEDWRDFLRAALGRHWPAMWAHILAWRDLLVAVPSLAAERRRLQRRRVRADSELFSPQQEIPPQVWHGVPELTWDVVVSLYLPLFRPGKTHPVPELQAHHRRPHLLIVSNDVVDHKMAGPGMRYLEMSRALSRDLDVTLAVPAGGDIDEPEVRIVRYSEASPGGLRVLVENSDVALVSGYMVAKFPFLHHVQARVVVDLYDPFILENLHYYVDEPLEAQSSFNRRAVEVTNQLASLGDFFICGSERQRDFWMGVLAANDRVNPYTFRQDPTLGSLIEVVSIGFPDREPRACPALRGKREGLEAGTRIVLWSGGVWDWLDPLTLVRAWPQVVNRHPEARLVILGTRHPNPLVPPHTMAERTERLAEEIGEKGKTVFFYEWLPYEELEGLLCEANVGVVLHPEHVETRYSIRTRVLDYFWTRLPVLVTDGDVTSEWVRRFECGRVVPPLDAKAVAEALCEMLDRPRDAWSGTFEQAREAFRWSAVVEPLRRYCLEGQRAPDREAARARQEDQAGQRARRRYVARAVYILRREGFRALLRRTWRYIRWRLARA